MSSNSSIPTVTAAPPRRVLVADLIGGLLTVGIMVGAYLMTRSLSPEGAQFPGAISIGGAVLGVVLVIRALLGTREPAQDDSEKDDDLDYVFHTATARQWVTTLAWFVAFFVALYVLGLYAASLLFAALYLRFQDNRSWVFAGIYSVTLTGVLYLAFTVLLAQPIPAGYVGLA